MVALFVIATFLIFLAIDFFVQRGAKPLVARGQLGKQVERFVIPRGYFFSPRHVWLEILGSGNARIGIDDFIQKVIGSIESVRLVPAQVGVKRGDPIMTIRQNGRELSIKSPISGKIVDVNTVLLESPELLTQDPYLAGWVATIQPENLSADVKTMSVAAEAATWLRNEVARFRDFVNLHTPQLATGVTMLDGGVPILGVLQGAEPAVWKEFEREFLSNPAEQG
jgi:glycine cleavage system H protein